MSLTFYFAPNSTASTVHWTLEELGIPYEAVQVDLKDAADKKKKLGPVNPNAKVPVLVHEGHRIFESAAIQIYLGETFGVDKGLYPAPGPARGNALKWLVWANVTLAAAVERWYRNTSPELDAAHKNAEVAKEARKEIDKLVDMIDTELEDNKYILGDDISIVDFHMVSFMHWLAMCQIDLAPFPRVSEWVKRCSARPANMKLAEAAA